MVSAWLRRGTLVSGALALSLTACGSDGDGNDGGKGSDDAGATDSNGDGDGDGDGDTTPPMISNITITPSPANHLAILVGFETDELAMAEIEITDGDGVTWTGTSRVSGFSTTHELEIIGLRQLEEFLIYPKARDEAGNVGGVTLSHIPAPLPDDFPPMVATGLVPDDQPGWTFFNVFRWADIGIDQDYGYVIGVDRQGRVVWYRRVPDVSDVRFTDEQTLVMIAEGDREIVELDLYGRELDRWRVDEVSPAVVSFHHELFPRPDGSGFWTLGLEARNVDGYDDGMGGTVAYDIVGDTIINLDRDGTVQSEWSLLDTLDMADWYKATPQFFAPFWDGFFPNLMNTKDWSHGNALVYDAPNDQLLVSARHLDWIVAIDAQTGDRKWKLGDGGDFTLTSGKWFSYQHAVEVQADGSIQVYDNGNYVAGTGWDPGDVAPTTRVARFTYDPMTMEATEVWSWQADPARFAQFVGDADTLSNGHVLVTDGGLLAEPLGAVIDPMNTKYAIISEVDPDTGNVVFELEIGGPAEPTSYTVYRAERWAGPY